MLRVLKAVLKKTTQHLVHSAVAGFIAATVITTALVWVSQPENPVWVFVAIWMATFGAWQLSGKTGCREPCATCTRVCGRHPTRHERPDAATKP